MRPHSSRAKSLSAYWASCSLVFQLVMPTTWVPLRKVWLKILHHRVERIMLSPIPPCTVAY